MDADSYREELIKVRKQRDSALKDIKTTQNALTNMKKQVKLNCVSC